MTIKSKLSLFKTIARPSLTYRSGSGDSQQKHAYKVRKISTIQNRLQGTAINLPHYTRNVDICEDLQWTPINSSLSAQQSLEAR